MSAAEFVSASPWRRLGAMIYDFLLLFAVLMLATVPFLPFLHGRVLVPREVGALAYVYWLWEVIVVVAFLGFFWTRKGCTLGMQAWRLRIETLNGQRPSWRDVIERVAFATLPWLPAFLVLSIAEHTAARRVYMTVGIVLIAFVPLNYLAGYWDVKRRALHERTLQTRIVSAT